ncbi:MAG: TetR/AcrR family transcriptional regulator [Devosiaceae bacterium]
MLNKTETKAVIKAFTNALMTSSYNDITLRKLAEAADVPLAKLLMSFSTKLEVFEGFAKQIDEVVLAEDDPDMAEEPARERLFDVFMRRFDALLPYKLALIQLSHDGRRDPTLLLGLSRVASKSMARMAASADIDVEGPRGAIVLAGMVQVYGRVMGVFTKESDEGQALTMAELDKALRQAERRIGDLDGLVMLMRGEGGANGGPLCRLRERMRRKNDDDAPEAEAA